MFDGTSKRFLDVSFYCPVIFGVFRVRDSRSAEGGPMDTPAFLGRNAPKMEKKPCFSSAFSLLKNPLKEFFEVSYSMKKRFLLNAAPSNTTALLGHGNWLWIAPGACRTYASRLDFCPTRKKQASCLLLPSRLRSFSPPSMAAFPRYHSALSSVCESIDSHPSRNKPPACFFRAAFVRFRRPPWRLFLTIAQRSLREASLRLAHQKQTSCLLLVCRLRSFSPPSVAAFPRYRSALSTVCESLDSHPSRNKPPACFFRAAFVRFRRPPWRLFFAIAQRSLREASLRLPLQKQASCLLLPARLRSLPPPSMAAFPRYCSALSTVCESLDSHTPLPRCQNAHTAQLRLSFCRLVSEKNYQKSPRSHKVRQTPKRQQWIPNDI